MSDHTNQLDAAARALPPAAVTYSDLVLNTPVDKWLTIVMIIYTVLQIGLLVRDRVLRKRREGESK